MLSNYFEFKKDFKLYNKNKEWTKIQFWKELEAAWEIEK